MTVMLERPETETFPDGPPAFEALCRTLLTMDVPDGYRAEIVSGSIVVSPWSRPYYMRVMRSLRKQFEPHVPDGHLVDLAPFLFTFPQQERAYGPDLYAAPMKAFEARGRRYVDGEALSLVAELTSPSTRDNDWEDKVRVYGQAGVPVYLLVDMQEERTAVFWDPRHGGYASQAIMPFGKKLPIPAPFDFDLDTDFGTAD
jgi:hypothetical protein